MMPPAAGLDHASGFVYFVSITGITGTSRRQADDVACMLSAFKSHTDLPVASALAFARPNKLQVLPCCRCRGCGLGAG